MAEPFQDHGNSDLSANKASPKLAEFDEAALLKKLFWTVPETAFIARVSLRTLWRELSNPKSRFPRARRIRRRTLFVRDEVLAFLAKETRR
jgi:hypothetical protein